MYSYIRYLYVSCQPKREREREGETEIIYIIYIYMYIIYVYVWTQIGMFRPIRMDHTNCLQVAIKSIQYIYMYAYILYIYTYIYIIYIYIRMCIVQKILPKRQRGRERQR